MDRIGIRELRQNASKYLDRVKKGESIEVTERGELIAVLSPPPKLSGIDRLVAEGLITRPVPPGALQEWLVNNPPAKLPEGARSPSEILQEMRDEDTR